MLKFRAGSSGHPVSVPYTQDRRRWQPPVSPKEKPGGVETPECLVGRSQTQEDPSEHSSLGQLGLQKRLSGCRDYADETSAALYSTSELPGCSQQPCEVGREGRLQSSPFTHEDAEAQRGGVTCPRSHSQQCTGPKANILEVPLPTCYFCVSFSLNPSGSIGACWDSF